MNGGDHVKFFEKYFGGLDNINDSGEAFVKCPFPHVDENGDKYYETNPSAHINTDKGVFHCKVCGTTHSEQSFLAKVEGITYKEALVFLGELDKHKEDSFTEARKNFLNSAGAQQRAQDLGIFSVHEKLKLGFLGEGLSFPVYIYDELLDIRTYRPEKVPKVVSEKGAKSLLLPFDLWVKDERPTLLCAGEKDMAISRSNGFNAITFTGGEQAFPKLFKASFRGKYIYIVYDNDQAGQEGARKVAAKLKEAGAIPHVVTGHYEVCTEKGGDIHDFFKKYGKSSQDLQTILDETPEFSADEYEVERNKLVPLITLEQATQGQYHNRLVRANVQVTITDDSIFQVPEYVTALKTDATDKCSVPYGTEWEWVLDESTMKDILYLMDSNLKEKDVRSNLRTLMGIPPKENFISSTTRSRINIFKATITDNMENHKDDEKVASEMVCYCIGERLHGGKKYQIEFKPVPHALQSQKVIAIITKLEENDAALTNFEVNRELKESLKVFQVAPGQTVSEKMDEIAESHRGHAGAESKIQTLQFADLAFHTPLSFKFGKRSVKGTSDFMMVGESRTGKSEPIKKLMEMYELGMVVSLKTTTEKALVGGSSASPTGGYRTKIGVLPRNHKGLVVLEEFSGGGKEMISKLTEVRSSGRARITRVDGHLDVPASVRMISISNQQTENGNTKPLRQYPNGVQILLELVGAAEDITRYDLFLIIDNPELDEFVSPLDDFGLESYPEESYRNRVRWIWTRNEDQIEIDRPTAEYIIELSKKLMANYSSHIKFFGFETWKKLAKLSIACAACVCSMDETGEKLIVKQEHVTWAKDFIVNCYDNDLFKLKEYVQEERMYNAIDVGAVSALQGIYDQHKTLVLQMEMSAGMQRRQMATVSGLDNDKFNQVFNRLIECKFVQLNGEKVIFTGRFREAMKQISRNKYMKKVGEE